MRSFVSALMMLMIMSVSASGAVLRSIEGGVSVNVGQGYSRIATPRNLEPGNRVRTSANGSAELVYPNGCIFKISPNQRVRVLEAVSCGDDGIVYLVGGAALVGGIAAIAIANNPASP